MSAPVDLARVAELGDAIGGDVVALLLESMERATETLTGALRDGELEAATQAAHAFRNDALMVGAAPLLAALTDVETAARDSQLAAACDAFERVAALWPAARAELKQAARPR